jgi:segregation and condensation protein A
VDIYDIPIALITKQYLEYLDVIREMNIGMAGEFLVMAATLTHIKSRMLLPSYDSSEAGDAEEDPRGDLVEALKEHMRIKDAADRLSERPWLDRDVFARAAAPAEVKQVMAEGQEVISAGVFDLIEAFRRLLRGRGAQLTLSVKRVKVTLEDRMGQILDLLRGRKTLLFEECFPPDCDRGTLVVTFLALLELTRLGLVKVYQERAAGSTETAVEPARRRGRRSAAHTPEEPAGQQAGPQTEPQADPQADPQTDEEDGPQAERPAERPAEQPADPPAGPQAEQQAVWSPLRLYFHYKAQERWAETPAEREEDEQA